MADLFKRSEHKHAPDFKSHITVLFPKHQGFSNHGSLPPQSTPMHVQFRRIIINCPKKLKLIDEGMVYYFKFRQWYVGEFGSYWERIMTQAINWSWSDHIEQIYDYFIYLLLILTKKIKKEEEKINNQRSQISNGRTEKKICPMLASPLSWWHNYKVWRL